MIKNFTNVAKTPNDQKKADSLKNCREYHKELFSDLGITKFDFMTKRIFQDQHDRIVIGVYPSEFKREKGMFIEIVDEQYEPLYSDRRVYRIAPNENYMEEYEETAYKSYLVPVDELRLVNPTSVALFKSSAVTSSDKVLKQETFSVTQTPTPQLQPVSKKEEDAPYSEMTIRDYYAMLSGKPVSLKPWLNELIKSK